ncbi:PolC-type DNA polymerase III [Paenibacillus apiarius]|uniref:DNA polymerase III PolC-type n=1 Tax=Paenibacillus apiarius TaxID=46240 RepID=A0ABT4DM18_9BACL|nr:PolC-type DNA polymerase III [Paenibacillus apiarius]MCY9516135.1 PolC-type DNA polymerase III [Paenibacillus apiarius]MCY9518406.1 PolC-type DNA polymerase III [Paenibacillus apiarius]MCY9551193.1 PolC-type DNA polymerase III [Paenibacillus apiarius]MCY9558347.1 PolC-type DNA polymerase III [Paenibacillus apiarius]MCY9684747.1 PolC-type DNA polymerase III [Paenibacillus apiarius]
MGLQEIEEVQEAVSDKRQRFELLMKQADIPGELAHDFFQDGRIEQVECSRSNREWTIHIGKSSVVPAEAYRSFCLKVQDKMSHIAKIRIIFHYDEQVASKDIVEAYWGLFVEWVKREVASVNGWLHRAKVETEQDHVKLTLSEATTLELAKKKQIDNYAVKFFETYFKRTLRVTIQAGSFDSGAYEEFQAKLVQEERNAIQQIMESAEREVAEAEGEAPERLQVGYDIKDNPTPIMDIQDEEKRVTVQGAVFGLEVKELRNGSTLFTFNLTDFSDSIMLKMFAKTKEDVKMLSLISDGKWIKARGRVEYDRFMQVPELVMMPSDVNEVTPPAERKDTSEEKRVEFHLHSAMSAMDAVASISDYIKQAAKWGHPAIAVTDHGNVQCYPEAAKAAKKHGIKMIYGLEANVVNDDLEVVMNSDSRNLKEATYVVFDIETTGLSVSNNKIIEIAGVKMQDGKEIGRYASFVNPHERIPYNIQQLTNITDEMVQDAPEIDKVLPEFVDFAGDAILVAHNARFDMGFVQNNLKKLGLPELTNPVLDTLELARLLHPGMKNHRLNTLADKYKVSLENHHRAIDDTIALGGVLIGLLNDAYQIRGIEMLERLNDYVGQNLQNARPFHCNIYAMNPAGKKNLFKLISISHTQYFKRVACIPKSKLVEMREGLLIMSGCEKGEFFETVLNKSLEEAEQVAEFYDVLEIQPLTMYMHLVEKGLVGSTAQIHDALRKVVQIGDKLNKLVVATGNVHYLNPRDKLFRDITIHGITGFSPLKDIRKPDAHFRTTNEMLQEFEFLGKDLAYKVVVKNTNELAERFEDFRLFPDKLFTPIIDGADEEMRTKCYDTAKQIYGEPVPEIVVQRLEKELEPIIKYGFSANYLISERLVKKSNEDGYLVGSRGSVGSSVVATFLGISEVNPLPPHYVCRNPECKHSEWFTDGSVPSGFDLPDKNCPNCGQPMKGEGQDIPFETFLGFKGDKVPDIDLNFSGEYQPIAHNYTKVLFGEKSVFRAGTIGTVAEKTAYGFAKKYEEDYGKKWRGAELNRLAAGCTGVKRSTGQHPGGIVVVPDYIDVEDVTPVQFPADDTSAEWKTTHFDYHAFEDNLLKLDILGHDDPTMMRMLQDLTGVDPTTIPMNDKKVMSMFNSTDALGVTPQQIRTPVATFGIPEMGTRFVRQMLVESQPSSFADLLQISGLSHGTGVWLGNAQDLIKNGICTIKTVIGCRDEIMLYLIYKAGMDAGLAFKITESVRKGRGLTPEWIEEMKRCNVPQWYIDSCLKIQYMFPKAHAAAYVISAVRTAYFKLYHPIEFYATYFTVRAEDFDIELCCQGYEAINRKIDEIEAKGFQATTKEKSMIAILEMAVEMTARGFSFKPIDLYRSDATKFLVDGDALIPPFSAVQGIGENAARNIAASREGGEYLSVEDFQMRSKATKTIVELLNQMGCFRGLPESNQLSLF